MTTNFDPNAVADHHNTVFGLPFDEASASLVIIPVPWDATVSYREGTSMGPAHILESSYQVDLYDMDAVDEWKKGIYMCDIPEFIHQKSIQTREMVEHIIEKLEQGEKLNDHDQELYQKINSHSREVNEWVAEETKKYVAAGKQVGLLGGDHSTILGFLKTQVEVGLPFSVLQIDAHMDLRPAYEGFDYSHASIMYNVKKELPQIQKIVQVGLRDYCDEEVAFAQNDPNISQYFDHAIRRRQYNGERLSDIWTEVLESLDERVYITIDIDGLMPHLCPHTGTPVPGGLEIQEVYHLLHMLVESGKKIVGFDLCEVATDEDNESIDSIVGARMLYKLSNLMLKSNG